MKRTVLIVVDGGRIQDVFCDADDVCVLVKNYDDYTESKDSESASSLWPAVLADPRAVEIMARKNG